MTSSFLGVTWNCDCDCNISVTAITSCYIIFPLLSLKLEKKEIERLNWNRKIRETKRDRKKTSPLSSILT